MRVALTSGPYILNSNLERRTDIATRLVTRVRTPQYSRRMGSLPQPRGLDKNSSAIQLPFDSNEELLSDMTFVIVDLETAGGSAASAGITEIGAVKVRGGQVLGEFRTFCNPGIPIPAHITLLTGISDVHVRSAPSVREAVAQFLAFSGFDEGHNPVLVAHNAPFDEGFLKSASALFGLPWPKPRVLDTVTLARQIISREEIPNHKLGTLARFFNVTVLPTHRALDDARATVEVLHHLIERAGPAVRTFEDLKSLGKVTDPARRAKQHLMRDLPDKGGVYIFYDAQNSPLYVGMSGNIRRRVSTYFTQSENRKSMKAMVMVAHRVEPIVCATRLERMVREIRYINELQPRYNMKSRRPGKAMWITLTAERFPRLSLIRQAHPVDSSRNALGPFRSSDEAELAMSAIYDAFPIRQCKDRFTAKTAQTPCALGEMNKCIAPCVDGSDTTSYTELISQFTAALTFDTSPVAEVAESKMSALASAERFEEAAAYRDRLRSYAQGAARLSTIRQLSVIPELVAAAPTADGGWDIHVIKHGWLASSAVALPDHDPRPIAQACRTTAATYLEQPTLVAETEMILDWLGSPATRLVHITPGFTWAQPLGVKPWSH